MAEDIVTSITSLIQEGLLKPIGRQLRFLVHFNKNVQDLREQVDKLESVKYKVQLSIDTAQRKGEHIKLEAEKWLTDAEMVTEDARKLEDDVQKRCFNGWCPDWSSRFWLSKELSRNSIIISELHEDGNFDEVSYPVLSPRMESLPSRDFQTFESTKSAMNQIIELLKSDDSHTVCVYGMGGIGKTTLVKEVGKKAKEEKLFDEVVTAVVSQAPDLINIQGELADALGLEFKRKTVTGRASQLCQRLKMEKRILIILDDVWNILDLAAIGIPLGIDHRGCKILLTTRLEHVCNVMGGQATKLRLNILDEQESWALFRSNAGAIIDSPAVNAVAREVAKKCGGLPLTLVTVGKALIDKDLDGWQEAAKQLREHKPTNIQDMDASIFACLKLSSDYLQGEEITLIFLLCCLFPEDCDIELEYLARLGMGQGCFKDITTIDEARRRVRTLINCLKSSSLLMESDKCQGCVKIHDLCRAFAISITCTDQYQFMVKSGAGLRNWPKKDTFEHCAVISLMANYISDLPVGLECPRLHTLLLGSNHGLKVFPDSFFEGMKALRVLDVGGVSKIFYNHTLHVTPLPASIQLLADLRMLHLHHRKLGDISILGKLKRLEILSLFASYIKELPKEIGELKSLRLLDLTYCRSLKKIPPNLISGLSGLEELYMRGSFRQWEVCGTTKERSIASLTEFKSLPCLAILHIEILNSQCLPKDFLLPTLLRFQIYIGAKLSFTVFTRKLKVDYPTSKKLELKGIDSPIPVGIKELLERTEDLSLICLEEGSCNILPHLGSGGFNALVSLSVRNCFEFECITNTIQRVQVVAFPNLETLHLSQLGCLRLLCIGTLPRGSFRKLKALTVEYCGRLSTLFPANMLQMLQNLERVRISWCQEMQEVFQLGGILMGEERDMLLSTLRVLQLNVLPQLGYVWKGLKPHLSLHNLEVFEIESCKRLRNLFQPSMAQSLSKLEYFKISDCAELEQIVAEEDEENHEPSINQADKPCLSLPKLKVLEVKGCEKLKTLFSVSTAQSLLQLKQVKISGSKELKEIISRKEGELSAVDKIVLPQLSCLKLKSLPVFESFCKGNIPFEWPSLEKVVLKKCPKMTSFAVAASDVVNHTPKLKRVRVDGKIIDYRTDLNMAINHLFKGKVCK